MKELPREDLTLEKLKDFITKSNDFYDTIICYTNRPQWFTHELLFVHDGRDYSGCYIQVKIHGEWHNEKRRRQADIALKINDKIVLERQDFDDVQLSDFYKKAIIFAEEMHDKLL